MSDDIFCDGFDEFSFLNQNKLIAEKLYEKCNKELNIKYKLNFNYFNNNSVNASVDYNENIDYIYFNVGTIRIIYETFYSLFANPNVLPHIGNAYKEISQKKVKVVFDSRNKRFGYTHVPRCEIRKGLAEFLCIIALDYVIAHELGHIFNGHTKFLKEKSNLSTLNMFNNNEKDNINLLDYKTMEMDADAYAMTSSISNILYLYDNPEKIKEYEFKKDKNLLIKLWFLSICILFMIFEDKYPSEGNWENSKYLPNRVRHFLNFNIACECLNEHIEISKYKCEKNFQKDFYDVLNDSIIESEMYYNLNFDTKHNWCKYVKENCEDIRYSQIVLDNWENIAPELKKYSRIRLYNKNMKLYDFLK